MLKTFVTFTEKLPELIVKGVDLLQEFLVWAWNDATVQQILLIIIGYYIFCNCIINLHRMTMRIENSIREAKPTVKKFWKNFKKGYCNLLLTGKKLKETFK